MPLLGASGTILLPKDSSTQQACRAYGAKAWYGTRRRCVLVGKDGRIHALIGTMPFFRPRIERLIAAIDALPPGSGAYPSKRVSVRPSVE